MMEDKLINNEETKKFKQAVDVFLNIRYDWPREISLLLPLMFYLAKEKMLKIEVGKTLGYFPHTLINYQETTEVTTRELTLHIEGKAPIYTLVDMVHPICEVLSETKSLEVKKSIIKIAKIFISLPDNWFKENATIAFEYIIGKIYFFGGKRGTLPKEIVELIKFLFDAKEGTVYNPYSGTGELIGAIGEDTIYHGQEATESAAHIAQLRLLLAERSSAKVQINDPAKNWLGQDFSYDYIVTNALNDLRKETPQTKNSKLLNQIAHDSNLKAIGIFPNSICFSFYDSRTKTIDKLLELDILETVIRLPPGIIQHTNITPIIIVINKMKERPGFVHFIDAIDCHDIHKNRKRLNIDQLFRLLKDDEDKVHQAYASNNSIIENNYNLTPNIYTQELISIPEGFHLRSLKQILSPYKIDKTVATEGFLFSFPQVPPYRVLNYSELPRICKHEFGGFVSQDFLAVDWMRLKPYYITTEEQPIFVSPLRLYLIYKLDTSQIYPSYLLTEMSKDYFKEQAEGWRFASGSHRISSEQFLELKILVPDKFEDQVTLALEAGNKDLKDQWKRLNEQYEEKLEEFKRGQRLRKHAVAQVLNDLVPAVKYIKFFIENDDNFEPHSIVSKDFNPTLLQMMQSIDHNLNRVVDMVSKFTDLENYSDGESIQINEFLEDYCRHILTNEKYRITLDLTDDIYWTAPSEDTDEEEGFTLTVKIGRAELIQILDNLITNAHKHGFTDPNRMDYEIRLTTEVETKDTPTLLLKVANNGEPVSRSIPIEQLFTWGISNGKTEGSGLGCWQAKTIAEHYNGKLTYQEHPDDENGFVCEFTLSLPLDFD